MAKKKKAKAKSSAATKARTKSQVFGELADCTELPRRQVAVLFDGLAGMIKKDLGKRGPGTFTVPGRTTAVFVFGPQGMIGSLIEEIQALVDAGVLTEGQGNALMVKLWRAAKRLDMDRPALALNILNAFVNQVNSFIDYGVLTPEEGQELLEAAYAIIDQIKALYGLE